MTKNHKSNICTSQPPWRRPSGPSHNQIVTFGLLHS